MPLLLLLTLAPTLRAQEARPLSRLPYSPSLDVTSMDRGIDPCTDFYKYSCGGWQKKNPIPADQPAWDVYGKLTEENEEFLWGILEEAAKPRESRGAVEREIGDYFAACMDEVAIGEAGIAPLKTKLNEIAGLQSANDLAAFLAREHQGIGGSLIFGIGSNQDFGDSSRVIAFATAGGLGLPDRDYYFKQDAKSQEIRAKYLEYVRQMLELAGDPAVVARTESTQVMAIETTLAKATLTRVERRDPYKLYHKISRKQFQALAPSFGWDTYFAGIGLTDLNEINVTQPAFYRELGILIKAQKIEDWKPYLRAHLTSSAAPYLSSKFVRANFDFYSKYLQGIPEMRPRWKRCVSRVDDQLGEALGQAFVAKAFSPEAKQRAFVMTKEIEAAMQKEIAQLPWMDEETRKQAFGKLHAIVNKIGYPDRWRDYNSIRITRDDFLGNVERASTFEVKRQLAKIGKPVDRTEWDMTPPTVNADYNPQMNDINFPAGVLQPPLFDLKIDDAPNYGDTGATMGHELTHGFDDEGRQFDAKGDLRDWWTKKDAEEFKKRAKCISDQYAEYTVVDEIKINSKLTLGEDIADLGGTLLGYIAWKHTTEGQNLKPIDGLTPDQRFFVGMAQWACANERPEEKRVRAITDPHSPEEYRVNGVVANMPEFAQAFTCKAGQPMVRAEACRIW